MGKSPSASNSGTKTCHRALATGDLDKLKPAISTLQRSVLRAKDRRRPIDR
jgi:hypothetical protein